jgi:mono/diheme cytochrome c family protein
MTHRLLGGMTLALASAATIAACGGSSSSTTSAPSPSSAPAASSAAARPGNASNVTPAMIAMGDSIYHARSCRNCHGAAGEGGQRAPALNDGTTLHVNTTIESYVKVITDGVPVEAIKDKKHTVAMRPRGGPTPAPLTDDQIKAVAAYVMTLKKG